MSRKQCRESLELYKKFVVRMELVAKFLAVAEVCRCMPAQNPLNDTPAGTTVACGLLSVLTHLHINGTFARAHCVDPWGFVEYSILSKLKFHLARHVTSWHDSTRSTCQAHPDERVEPCCSTSSTQPKCMGSKRRTCRVVSKHEVTSQVEFELYWLIVIRGNWTLIAVCVLYV